MIDYKKEYQRWCQLAILDQDIIDELKSMNEEEIEDAFYRHISFGTGGLRGTIGAGTNRLNVYTVSKVSQGLSHYLLQNFSSPSVVIGYDSRLKSKLFAQMAASVFAANGILVHIWPELTPVPTVSYATRYLHASAGIMITASHNPSQYNGYKVYAQDGCQITTKAASDIFTEIEKLDIFQDVKYYDFDQAVNEQQIQFIKDEVLTAFIEEVKNQSVLYGEEVNKDLAIVYSPLNGTGYIPVTRTLKEMGYTNLTVVEEQRLPDGHFPTCPYPNPEVKEAMSLGIEYAKKKHADLFIATDPDCDRIGIAVKNKNNEYILLSGNETGMLLLDYICSQRIKHHTMPKHPIMMKTIVTTDMGELIANHYGVETINVLTGFKFIGEQIGLLEEQGKLDDFIFGFEESYGCLSGGYIRDKDGVGGAYLVCEMFSYYATQGISLLDKLDELYHKFGYCLNTQHCFQFEGSAGLTKMHEIMNDFHTNVGNGTQSSEFAGKKIYRVLDYSQGLDGLPKSDVLKYLMEGNCSVVVRPSGTEPKLKTYISVNASTKDEAVLIENQIVEELQEFFK